MALAKTNRGHKVADAKNPAFSKSLPYFRWFPKDYRASRNANALNYIARGLLRELLDECWEEGYIHDDLERLAEVCRCPIGVISRYWPRLRPMFVPVDGLDGQLLTNARLEKERTEQDRKRALLAAAGKRGGLQKASLAKADKCHIAGAGVGAVESFQDSTAPTEHGSGPTLAASDCARPTGAPWTKADQEKANATTIAALDAEGLDWRKALTKIGIGPRSAV